MEEQNKPVGEVAGEKEGDLVPNDKNPLMGLINAVFDIHENLILGNTKAAHDIALYAINNFTPAEQPKTGEGEDLTNKNIDSLLSEFKRQGFDTSNWDGEEGWEKAIVDGVKNHISELLESHTNQSNAIGEVAGEKLTDFGVMYEKLKERYPLRSEYDHRQDYLKYTNCTATNYEIKCDYDVNVRIPNDRAREVYVDGWMDCYKHLESNGFKPTPHSKKQPAEQPKTGEGWVSVEERLPENNGLTNDRVLFVTTGNVVRVGCYDYEDGFWHEQGGARYRDMGRIKKGEKQNGGVVTYWMPLPAGPE